MTLQKFEFKTYKDLAAKTDNSYHLVEIQGHAIDEALMNVVHAL